MQKFMRGSCKKGFTLIELLVVMAIIGILSVIVIVAVNPLKNINQAKDSNVKSDMVQISHALLAYSVNNSGIYPADLPALAASGEINSVPLQSDGASYKYQRSIVCDSTGCSVVLWGTLNKNSPITFWCWASGVNTFKESGSEPASGSTVCP